MTHAKPPGTKPAATGDHERRRQERVSLEATVGFGSDTNFYTGFSEDISEGGLFLATYDLKPPGTEVDLQFALPNGHEVRVHGIVRWIRDPHHLAGDDTQPGMGIQFQGLGEPDRRAIGGFIAARSPLFYDE